MLVMDEIGNVFSSDYFAFLLPKRVRNNVWVWSPLVIPAASSKLSQNINKLLFSAALVFIDAFILFARQFCGLTTLSLLYINSSI